MGLFRFFRSLWRQRRRRIDLDVLWPVCKANAKSLEAAKFAFAAHVHNDPAWAELDVEHLHRVIATLD
jgi:hypothetical protein